MIRLVSIGNGVSIVRDYVRTDQVIGRAPCSFDYYIIRKGTTSMGKVMGNICLFAI